MDIDCLPKDWKMHSLDDPEIILNMQPGFACGMKDVNGGVPHLRMNNINSGGQADFSLVRRIPTDIAKKADKWLKKSDVVFCNTNSTELVGKSCLFMGWNEPCTFSNHLTRLRTNPKRLLSEWLLLSLRQLWLEGYFATNCREFIGQSAFNMDRLRQVEVPIPPLPEQRRIVKRIEELTRHIDKAIKYHREAIEIQEAYIPAAISSAFEDARSMGWIEKKVQAICEKPQYGYTESASNDPVGPKMLRITDIQRGMVNWQTVPYCRCEEIRKYRLQRGDILFARTGATTGKSFLVQDAPKAIFASYLIRLRAKSEILPEFLFWFFQSSSYWQAVSSGIDDGNRPNMNGTKLANLRIPFPMDKLDQQRIVDSLNKLKNEADALYKCLKDAEIELESFVPALLSKAFRGEI